MSSMVCRAPRDSVLEPLDIVNGSVDVAPDPASHEYDTFTAVASLSARPIPKL